MLSPLNVQRHCAPSRLGGKLEQELIFSRVFLSDRHKPPESIEHPIDPVRKLVLKSLRLQPSHRYSVS